ncbi:hypothetical protein V1477_005819 [Vespula maculifrons]|uniref:Uncharacterized protein n=2 Tax=Vespula TaxID=7451 RepID=A0A836UL86_VESVU|nr:hypothetical protein HZH66_003346 [Vespula vulgaris]
MRREGVLGRRLVERSIDDETLDGKRPTRARIAVKIGKTQRARGEPVGRASESSNAKPSGCYTPRILVLVSAGNCHLLGASLPMGRLFFHHCKNVKRDIKGIAASPPYFVVAFRVRVHAT